VLQLEAKRPFLRPLLEEVADRDEIRWLSDLYERYSDTVRDTVLRLAGPRIDAEDMVQEIFLGAFRKSQELRDRADLGGWFYLAAVREVWRARRKARRLRYLSLGFAATPRFEDGEFTRRELAEWVYAVLDKLPRRQREALVLFHLQGLTSAEIGKLLGCPEETVRSRIFHGKRAFLKALARERQKESFSDKDAI
jgi:RNA polymerase sigma-70 factor (ECF subfamily)